MDPGANGSEIPTMHVYGRQAPIPELRIRELTGTVSDLDKRSNSDSSNGSSASQSAGGSSLTPIVIGVVVPVLIIAIILFVVWRRRSKIVKQEESHDKYRSLDFGVDPAVTQETKRRKPDKHNPEMSFNDSKSSTRRNRGVSMDLEITNPYLLPPEVQQSRESLHSLSRSINTGDDKYRATSFVPDDGSIRPASSLRSAHDSSSMFTGSTRRYDTESKSDLLPRPPTRDTSQPPHFRQPLSNFEKPHSGYLAPSSPENDRNSTLSNGTAVVAARTGNNYSTQYASGGKTHAAQSQPRKEEQPGLIVTETEVNATPPLGEPRQPPATAVRGTPPKRSSSFYGDHTVAELAATEQEMKAEPKLQAAPRSKPQELDSTLHAKHSQRPPSHQAPEVYHQVTQKTKKPASRVPSTHMRATKTPDADDGLDYYQQGAFQDYQDYVDYTYRGSMMGVRPLPPDDPAENPEQRANRIRSFYKEYFDDGSGGSKHGPPASAVYYDGSEQYNDDVYGYYHQPPPRIGADGRHRAMSQGNPGHLNGARAFSSMSGRMGSGPRLAPKKKLPPPKPLMLLPTPGKLRADFIPDAIDFAPPQVFKNQRAGTPDSGRGGLRPYSPSVRAHVPLTSSFDDLAVIPSPHSMRRSGTFTNLDFAPPRRFNQAGEAMSETGSIRSNRSNLSQMHLANIRNGAYRVSRIPKEVAGTKDDMHAALRPKWDMRGDSAVPGR